ncbi:hypothetical protein ABEW00_05000 [Rossellomorea vietnamensis]|uniref:hypothetical protein n=1 Tax=Rossellomorea vietnamensis TaxID=218284 RepID=UPI003D274B10
MRKKHCEALISECEEMLTNIEEKIKWHLESTEDKEILMPKIKSFLEHSRSVLEYCAQDIFENVVPKEDRDRKLNGRNRNVYFPYGKDEPIFLKNLENNLPNLSNDSVFKLIEGLQDFKRFNKQKFLNYMCSLTNENKHNQLSEYQRKSDKSLSIGNAVLVDGSSKVTIKNCSFNGIPSGDFTIVNGNIEGNINSLLLKDVVQWDNGSYVFKDTKMRVTTFLKLCLTEIKQFQKSLYKII